MLDPRFLRDRAVGCSLFVAFAAYFGVFAIFFLTALYLDLVVGYSGARMAVLFAPMAVAIVVGAVASGRWVAPLRSAPADDRRLRRSPPRASSAARHLLVAAPPFAALAAAIALAGLGFGIAVVPLTSRRARARARRPLGDGGLGDQHRPPARVGRRASPRSARS